MEGYVLLISMGANATGRMTEEKLRFFLIFVQFMSIKYTRGPGFIFVCHNFSFAYNVIVLFMSIIMSQEI